ncbi:MAG: thermonuclease family protein [Magnetococcales bacterium]|nr:thermonuclease family protein [Magnetococcales bacterium]NGZ29457.1 thermonuclease family protein [Magnetococcales bacterium]
MIIRWWLFLLVCLCPPLYGEVVVVKQVLDGDTFITTTRQRVRVIGIDTPEVGRGKGVDEPFAQQAKQLARDLLYQQQVTLTPGEESMDPFGRTLAYVTLPDGSDFAHHLLKQGLAMVRIFPPNLQHIPTYLNLEAEARRQKMGIWLPGSEYLLNPFEANKGLGHHRLVSGRVVHISQSRKRVYLHFGIHRQSDFTVGIRGDLWQTLFHAHGLNKNSLLGQRVLVRGKLYHRGGVSMNLDHPWEISVGQ